MSTAAPTLPADPIACKIVWGQPPSAVRRAKLDSLSPFPAPSSRPRRSAMWKSVVSAPRKVHAWNRASVSCGFQLQIFFRRDLGRNSLCAGRSVLIWEKRYTPLPLRYIGIIDLGGKPDLIYGAQSLTGKILRAKDLCPAPVRGNIPPPPWDDGLVSDGAQGQMSQRGCGKTLEIRNTHFLIVTYVHPVHTLIFSRK
jgi:hypothetical protein